MCGSGRERLRERGQGRSREKLRHTDTDRHRHRHRHRHTQKGPHRYTPMAPICSRAPGAVVGMRSRAVSHPKRQRAAATVSAGRGLHQQTKPNKRGGRGRGGREACTKKGLVWVAVQVVIQRCYQSRTGLVSVSLSTSSIVFTSSLARFFTTGKWSTIWRHQPLGIGALCRCGGRQQNWSVRHNPHAKRASRSRHHHTQCAQE